MGVKVYRVVPMKEVLKEEKCRAQLSNGQITVPKSPDTDSDLNKKQRLAGTVTCFRCTEEMQFPAAVREHTNNK